MIKTIKKILLTISIVSVISVVFIYSFIHEALPQTQQTQTNEADDIAQKMLIKLNNKAWKDTKFIQWTFGKNTYLWDKKDQFLSIKNKHTHTLLDLKNYKNRKVWKKGKLVSEKQTAKIGHKQWGKFCNDSFWLLAPYKIFDKGTTRSIINLENNNIGLLVSYSSGGVTPGDKYLWILDQNHQPIAFKMWVSIIPIGGIKATWENWKTTETGAIISTQHNIMGLKLPIKSLKTGKVLSDITSNTSLFDPISNQNESYIKE